MGSDGRKTFSQKVCDNCAKKVPYTRIVEIGLNSSLKVCEDCYEREKRWRNSKRKNRIFHVDETNSHNQKRMEKIEKSREPKFKIIGNLFIINQGLDTVSLRKDEAKEIYEKLGKALKV